MEEHEVELGIGDTLYVGNHTFTVIDIEGGEIHFRVELSQPGSGESEPSHITQSQLDAIQTRPR